MIRNEIARQLDHDPNFRWRGNSVTRIENLSDIVFALALGMLVSASTPPTTLAMLETHLFNIIPVALGFIFMLSVWNQHFTYFRRYGVADRRIIFLNSILLLAILFIAYPLRFVFDSLFAFILGQFDNFERMGELGIATYREAARITGYYAAGHFAIYVLIHAMYSHALNRSDVLALSTSESIMTRRSIWRHRWEMLVAVIVFGTALYTPVGPFAGFFFSLNAITNPIIRFRLPLPSDKDRPSEDLSE